MVPKHLLTLAHKNPQDFFFLNCVDTNMAALGNAHHIEFMRGGIAENRIIQITNAKRNRALKNVAI